MMLKNGGWSAGEYLTILSDAAGVQVVRVDAPRLNGGMRTVGYQRRTPGGVERFRRLADAKGLTVAPSRP